MTKYGVALFLSVVLFIAMDVHVYGQDITKMLGNQQVVGRQIMCVLDRAPCDQIGRQLKAALPEVINRNCRNCNAQQAANAQRLVRFLQTRYPEVWTLLVKKYRG